MKAPSNRVSATFRTAVYGPVRTVVWEGQSPEATSYPDRSDYVHWPTATKIDFRSRVSIQGKSRPVLVNLPGLAPEETCALHCETTSTPAGLRCFFSSAVRAREEYLTCGRTAPERISAHDCVYRKLI